MRDKVRSLVKKLAREYLKQQQSGFSIHFVYPNELKALKPRQFVRIEVSLVDHSAAEHLVKGKRDANSKDQGW